MKQFVIYLLLLLALGSCCSSQRIYHKKYDKEKYYLQVFSEDVELRKGSNDYVVDIPSNDTTFELQVRNNDGWWIRSVSVKNIPGSQFVPQYKDGKFYHGPLTRKDGWYEFETTSTRVKCHIYKNIKEIPREIKLIMTEGDFLVNIYINQVASGK